MAQIRIKIGAAEDRSVDVVFSNIEKRAMRTGDVVARALGGSSGNKGPYRSSSQAFDNAQKRMERASSRTSNAIVRNQNRVGQELKRGWGGIARVVEREMMRVQRAQRRAAQSQAQSFARRTSHRATRFMTPNAPIGSMARRALGDFARGAGIETHTGSIVGNVVSQEDLAQKLSTQGYVKGAAGARGQRVDKRVLIREARDLQKKYGFAGGTSSILEGGSRFVEQRGNLEGFRALAPELAKRAKSSNADFSDVAKTAAKIDSALSSQDEYRTNDKKRNQATLDLIDNFIRQGKVGSIEFDEQAKQISKLSGIAAGFTGDATKNLSELMTIAQLAERGPAKKAATATTYTQNFALDVPRRAKQFKDIAGVDIFNKEGKTRSLKDIILETLLATEKTKKVNVRGQGVQSLNQEQQIQKILPNKRSGLALKEFLNVFQGAGGGQKGIEAVKQDWEKFSGRNTAQLSEDLAAAMDKTSTRTAQFNAQMEDVVDGVKQKLVPAFEEATPGILKFAEVIGDVATWAVSNPKTAIGAAITASIARAGIESTLRAGIERAILGPNMGAPGVMQTASRGTRLAQAASGLGAALTITATAVTLYAAGKVVMDEVAKDVAEGQGRQILKQADRSAFVESVQRKTANTGEIPIDVLQEAQRRLVQAQKEQIDVNKRGTGLHGAIVDVGDWISGNKDVAGIAARREAVEHQAQLEAEIRRLQQIIERALGGELRVRMTNVSDLKDRGGVDPTGRKPSPKPGPS